MPISRRIGLFFFGLAMGSVMVYSMFKGRMPSWLPESVVLEKLQKQTLTYTPFSNCQIACLSISTKDIKSALFSGNVAFNKSKVHNKPCPNYVIESENSLGQQVEYLFESCDSSSTLVLIQSHPEINKCNCQ
tara:strand:+ start:65 stop:460 length:396 start_codon:yes stop_codon:yes gene_type:complete